MNLTLSVVFKFSFAKEATLKKKSEKTSNEVSRRKFIKSAATTAGIAGFPYFFVKAHAASDPKVFSAYIFDGNLGDFYDKHWYKPFAEKFDINIQYIRLKGSRVPLEKVQAQIAAGQPESDVVPMHGDQFIFAKRNNLLQEVFYGSLVRWVICGAGRGGGGRNGGGRGGGLGARNSRTECASSPSPSRKLQ